MVAGECSIVAGVIVTCILAVLSGLCLVLALVFFVYARRKLEQVTFLSSKNANGKKNSAAHFPGSNGTDNGAYLADDLNMQEAGSDNVDGAMPFHSNKNCIPGYVVCKEFFQNGHEKWSKGLPHDKLIYRLMAADVNFEARRDDNGACYLAFAGIKDHTSSPNSAWLAGDGKLLKAGDRVHALVLNCSALETFGADESLVELLLKLIEQNGDQQAVFVDVAASLSNERLVDADSSKCCILSKEHEVAATAELRQAELSSSESKDSGREETRTNSEQEHGDDASSVIGSESSSSPRNNLRRSRRSGKGPFPSSSDTDQGVISSDDVVVAVDVNATGSCSLADGEAIELAQHPPPPSSFVGSSNCIIIAADQLPLPAPDLLRTPPTLHSPPPSSSTKKPAEISGNGSASTLVNGTTSSPPTSPNLAQLRHLNGGHEISANTSKLDAYMAL